MTLGLLVGCGSGGAPGKGAASDSTTGSLADGATGDSSDSATENTKGSPAENTQETGSKDAAESSAGSLLEAARESAADDLKSQAEESKEAYEAFLRGDAPLYFDRANIKEYFSDQDGNYGEWPLFQEGQPYDLAEFTDVLKDFYRKESDNFQFAEIRYAYIDCGNDGVPELLLDVSCELLHVDIFHHMCVVKRIDGKLQLCYQEEYGYRSGVSVNVFGVIYSGGSGGASLEMCQEAYIDADGTYRFVYGVESESYGRNFLSLYKDMPGEDVESDVLDSVLYESYWFEEYGSGEGDIDWDAYYDRYVYTYYRTKDFYDIVEDASIYEADSPYYRVMHGSGRDVRTPEEVDLLLKEHKEKLGLKPEWEDDSAEPDWQILKTE